MGPSGAGKTTIISLVTGKAEKTAGTVKINGSEEEGLTKYQKLVGFVPQEDVMIRSLSVRDNIAFSARYRLPASLSDSEITRKVNECIEVLGVSHVQHIHLIS
jgi:ABC-type multidrug transport system ATPase subunit